MLLLRALASIIPLSCAGTRLLTFALCFFFAFSIRSAYVKGTVNDPTPFPEPNSAHGSNHWAFERTLSVALVPLVAAGFAKHGSSAILDGALALTLVAHSHIGFDCILADYLHKRKFPVIGPLCTWTLRAATLATLYGLYEFNTSKFTNPSPLCCTRRKSLLLKNFC